MTSELPNSDTSLPRSIAGLSSTSRTIERHAIVFRVEAADFSARRRNLPLHLDEAVRRSKRIGAVVIFQAPESLVLSQTVEVPAKILPNLAEMLPIHLKRWSPFPPGSMLSAATVVSTGKTMGTAEVRYGSKQEIFEAFDRLVVRGVKVDGILLGQSAQWLVPIRASAFRHHTRRRFVEVGLAAVALILAVTSCIVAFDQVSDQRAFLERETVTLTRAALDDQRRMQKAAALEAIYRASRAVTPRSHFVSSVLSDVAAWLPAEGRLTELRVDDTTLHLSVMIKPTLLPAAAPDLPGWKWKETLQSPPARPGAMGGDGAAPEVGFTLAFDRRRP